jgi:low temperature requirement protein LtrA
LASASTVSGVPFKNSEDSIVSVVPVADPVGVLILASLVATVFLLHATIIPVNMIMAYNSFRIIKYKTQKYEPTYEEIYKIGKS